MNQRERNRLRKRTNEAFSPAQPVRNRDLFAGRKKQFRDLVEIVVDPGQHGVLFGERGVGKTSLASVAELIFTSDELHLVRINCSANDTFSSIWRKIFEGLAQASPPRKIGFGRLPAEGGGEAPMPIVSGPAEVESLLRDATRDGASIAMFIDEFDRVRDQTARQMFADTIKSLADHGVDATIVLIGVADDVSELIAEHESIERALVQVHMPRMSPEELNEIVRRGMQHVDLRIERQAVERIVSLSQGLPHYTHLLARESARAAIGDESRNVRKKDVLNAMEAAISRTSQTLAESYHTATASSRAATRYPDVLLAAALAPTDQLGYFAPGDLRAPLQKISRRDCDIRSFSTHLHDLCLEDRGGPLQKTGQPRRYRFRFKSPSMRPYVIMRALADRQIDFDLLDEFLVNGKR